MNRLIRFLYLFLFLGFLNVLFSLLSGAVMMLTVVGLPLGKGLWQLASFFTDPQKRTMVTRMDGKAKDYELWRLFGIFLWIIYLPLAIFLTTLTLVQIGLLFLSWFGAPMARKILGSLGSVFYPVDRVARIDIGD